ncbi:MAG: hypothetical protein ABSB14_15075, partial [Candidatus Sulfotelmatobacter sp.]
MSTSKSRLQKVQIIVSHELDFGACAPLAEEFPRLSSLHFEKSLAITTEVLDIVIDIAAQESDVVVKDKVYGPGGYEQTVNASAQTRISGTRKAMQL